MVTKNWKTYDYIKSSLQYLNKNVYTSLRIIKKQSKELSFTVLRNMRRHQLCFTENDDHISRKILLFNSMKKKVLRSQNPAMLLILYKIILMDQQTLLQLERLRYLQANFPQIMLQCTADFKNSVHKRTIYSKNYFNDKQISTLDPSDQQKTEEIYHMVNFSLQYENQKGDDDIVFKKMKSSIQNYISKLLQNLVKDYLNRQSKSQDISSFHNFSKYFSTNILLNLISMAKSLLNELIEPHAQNNKELLNRLKTCLYSSIQNYLHHVVLEIVKAYNTIPYEQFSKSKIQFPQLQVKKINRTQNEEYGFLMVNNIKYKKGSQMVVRSLKTVVDLLQNGQKTKISKIIELLGLDQMQQKRWVDYHWNKMSNDQIMVFKKFVQTETITRQLPNIGILYNIISQMIRSIICLIEKPDQSTKNRKYPYKSIDNDLILPNEHINNGLYKNLQQLKHKMKDPKSEDKIIYQIYLLRQNFLSNKAQIIFEGHKNKIFQKIFMRQKYICNQTMHQLVQTAFIFLSKLIQVVIQAGNIENKDGKLHHINLINFNIDLFQMRLHVPINKIKQVLQGIDKVQDHNIRINIIKIENRLLSAQHGIHLSFLFDDTQNPFMFKLKLNIKQEAKRSNQTMFYFIKILNGNFGLLSQIISEISNYNLTFAHKTSLQPINQLIFMQNDLTRMMSDIITAKHQDQEQLLIKKKKDALSDIYLQNEPQDKSQQQILTNNEQNKMMQFKGAKYLYVINDEEKKFKKQSFQLIKQFNKLERVVINNFYDELTQVDFIKKHIAQKLIEVNLARNYISSLQFIPKQIRYGELKILDLSHNILQGEIILAGRYFPVLRNLNLSYNKFINSIQVYFDIKPVYQKQCQSLYEDKFVQDNLVLKSYRSSKTILITDTQRIQYFVCDQRPNKQTRFYHQSISESLKIKFLVSQPQWKSEKIHLQYLQQKIKKQKQRSRSRSRTKDIILKKSMQYMLKRRVFWLKDSSQYRSRQIDIIQPFAGLIMKQNTQIANAFVLDRSNVVLACTHSIKNNDYTNYKLKLKFKLPYLLKQQQFQNPFIARSLGQCDLSLIKLLKNISHSNNSFTIVIVNENQMNKMNDCYFSGYIVGYVHKQCLTKHFQEIKCDPQNLRLQFNLNLDTGSSGSIIIKVEKNGAYINNIFILGTYCKSNHNLGFGSMFNKKLKQELDDLSVNTSIKYCSFTQFIRLNSNKIESLQQIITNHTQTLRFIKTIFVSFIKLLNSYLFVKNPQIEIIENGKNKKFSFLLHRIFIYNYENSRTSYQVDFLGIKINTIFVISGKQGNQIKKILQFERDTFNLVHQILLDIILHNKNIQANKRLIISKFINYMKSQFNDRTPLIAILHILIIAIENSDENLQNITNYLLSNKDILQQHSYYNWQKIMINSNSLERIIIYSQALRCSKDSTKFFHKHKNNQKQLNEGWFDSFEQTSSVERNKIIEYNVNYISSLQKIAIQGKIIDDQWINGEGNEMVLNCLQAYVMKHYYEQICLQDSTFQKKLEQLKKRINQLILTRFEQNSLLLSRDINLVKQNFESIIVQEFNFMVQILINSLDSSTTSRKQKYYQRQDQSIANNRSYQYYAGISRKQSDHSAPSSSISSDSNVLYEQIPKIEQQKQKSQYKNSDLFDLDKDQNRKVYEQHIGMIVVFPENILQFQQNWKYNVAGTGIIIGNHTVLTTSKTISKILYNKSFEYKRIKFLQTHGQDQIQYNVSSVRLIRDLNLSILFIEEDLLSKIPLTVHNKNSNQSIFRQRKYFCQVIGFKEDNQNWKLQKSQGYIFLQEFNQTRFKYGLSTGRGMDGGVILFFPTGNYHQPFIFGINTDQKDQLSKFIEDETSNYVKQKYNFGMKYIYGSFQSVESTLHEQYYAKTTIGNNQYNNKVRDDRITLINSKYQNHPIFSQALYQINKWKFISNTNKFWSKRKRIDIYWELYLQVMDYYKHDLIFKQISPENLLCFDSVKYQSHALFETKIIHSQQNKLIDVKNTFLRTLNKYKRYTQAFKIIQKLLQLLNTNDDEIQQKFFSFIGQTDQIIQKIIENAEEGRKKFLCQTLNQIRINLDKFKEHRDKFTKFCQKKDLMKLFPEMFDFQTEQEQLYLNQYFQAQINWDNFQQKYFNDQVLLKRYMRFISQNNNQNKNQLISMSVKIFLKKTMIKITQKIFNLCYQKKIGKQLQKIRKYHILQNSIYQFDAKKQQFKTSIQQRYSKQINKRSKQVLLIQKAVNLSFVQRQELLESILNWNLLKKRWVNKLDGLQVKNMQNNGDMLKGIFELIKKSYKTKSQKESSINLDFIALKQYRLVLLLIKNHQFNKKLQEVQKQEEVNE